MVDGQSEDETRKKLYGTAVKFIDYVVLGMTTTRAVP